MRFGIREIAEVVFRAKATMTLGKRKFYKNEPVLYFDTLKTSSLEGASTTVYATGGRGNPRLIGWDGERTLTFTMEDALISPESFSILSGAGLIDVTEEKPAYIHTVQTIEVKEANKIELGEEACWNKYSKDDPYFHNGADIFVMTMTNGQIDNEPCVPVAVDADHKTLTCYSHTGTIDKGDVVKVDFYVKRSSGVQTVEISADKFGGNYYVEAQTLFRDEATGVDMPAEFVIPNCKVQSNFTFTMAATGDPSTFTFTMDAFPDYTKFEPTKKVLAMLQIVTEAIDSANDFRTPCVLQEVTSLTEGVDVTFDNDGTDEYCKLTVSGQNVNGTQYDPVWWGDKLNNAAELEITMPIKENGTYRLVTQNPMLQHYEGDEGIKKENGVWIKDRTYNIDDGSLTLRTAVTDDKGAILIKLFNGNDELIKTFSISNKVSFAKSYAVKVDNKSSAIINKTTLNEKEVDGEVKRAITGDRICLVLDSDAVVTAVGGTVTKEKDTPMYTITVGKPASGEVSIEIN